MATIEVRTYAPGEVAALFGVDPKTVTRWRRKGKLDNVRIAWTPGGHARYNADDIDALARQHPASERRSQ